MVLCCRILTIIALLAAGGSSLFVYPHQLAYFNELSGGPENGHKHLLHSNLDWGQDLLYAKNWLNDHSPLDHVYCQGYSMIPIEHLGICQPSQPSFASGTETNDRPISPGVYIINETVLNARGYPRSMPKRLFEKSIL